MKPRQILNDTWEVVKKIGQGTFSQIYLGRDVTGEFDLREDQSNVAIKVGSSDIDSSVIRWEGEVLRSLQSLKCTPKIFFAGNSNGQDFLVMEYFSGEDMGKVP